MGKRKRKDKNRHLKEKIRRLEDRLNRYSSSDSGTDEEYNDYDRYYPESYDYPNNSGSEDEVPLIPWSDSEHSLPDTTPKSVIMHPAPIVGSAPNSDAPCNVNEPVSADPVISTKTDTSQTLPSDILEALGDPKGKEEIYGPKIPDEISKRWGRVLVDGLEKDVKQKLPEKHLIPDNFRLAKAPILNPEIISVLNESVRYRDKLLEKEQNQLGLGISELTNLASAVITENLDKVEILKKLSEASQIFLDLHHDQTTRRRKLITTTLDKKFVTIISDVKRDTYLFGANLGEKIKATKTAETSGLQVKRKDVNAIASTSRKYPKQGNWRGPPRTYYQHHHLQRAPRQGGPRPRYPHQQRYRPPVPDRQALSTRKPPNKTPKA
ncbi:uncharacterized protein LOC133516489 [Cydia pomonella]|uniref:uncharacterized protein LOC133516489 n=1 Tax=Cydia pomonella TaxID=82600 RepID=UPI002ADD997B|nr:uncharacterized protein LOC133516489 [Cydia pomonella]XP_061705456.1 uncharacterized protein LOC133516489 [Cydia pomonella]